jgi:hypothetical protein
MAHRTYLIRDASSCVEGIRLDEKHNSLELVKALNQHYVTKETLDALFRGTIKTFSTNPQELVFLSSKVVATESINEAMDHDHACLYDVMIIFKKGKWTAYRSLGGFKGYGELNEQGLTNQEVYRET